MICIYHRVDPDGWCSAAIVKKKFPDAKFIGWDYGDPIPKVDVGEAVIMADVSFAIDVMQSFVRDNQIGLIWIDHHSSAIKEYGALISAGVRTGYRAIIPWGHEKKAACELVWDYLFPGDVKPEAVTLLGEHDSWRDDDKIRWDNQVMPFRLAIGALVNSPESFPQSLLVSDGSAADTIRNLTVSGHMILQYQAEMDRQSCADCLFKREIAGLKFLCLNTSFRGSPQFKSVWNPELYDGMMIFRYTPEKNIWACSMYSTKENVDCGAIAKSLGGGGHKGAAGFKVSTNDILALIDGNPDDMKGIYLGS